MVEQITIHSATLYKTNEIKVRRSQIDGMWHCGYNDDDDDNDDDQVTFSPHPPNAPIP